MWHPYAGAPLQLSLSWNDEQKPAEEVVLVKNLWIGERPQVIVERGQWQRAMSLGAWTLVGCTVALAFVIEAFEMAMPGWKSEGKSSTA